MGFVRRFLLLPEKASTSLSPLVDVKAELEEARTRIREMDAGIQRRDEETLFSAYMADALNHEEYQALKLKWEREGS